MLGVGSNLPIARVHHVVDEKDKKHLGNNTAVLYINDLVEYWWLPG